MLVWVSDRLRALGVDPATASIYAAAGVSVHELEQLLERGCPLATAVRILAPLPERPAKQMRFGAEPA